MIRDKRNIDTLFEEGLKKFKEQPPVYAWDRLDKGLDKAGFRKSLLYLRWMAASILILLAFGAGYYYAIFSLSTPEVADEINYIPSEQQIDTRDVQVKDVNNVSYSENSKERQSTTVSIQDDNLVKLSKDNKLVSKATNLSRGEKANTYTTEISAELAEPYQRGAIVSNLESIDIASVPVSLQLINPFPQSEKVISTDHTAIAIADPPPMSLHYYPEDYDLKPTINEFDTKWAVGAQFAPIVSYRDISINYQNQQGNLINDDESQLNNTEESLNSYGGGVDVNYHVSKRWSIQSGLYYSRIGQVNNDALNFKQDDDQYLLFSINTSTGDINVAFEKVPEDVRKVNPPKDTLESIDIGNVKLVQNFDVFEVPIMVKYKLLDKRFGINLSGGLSPGYLVSNSTYLEVDNNKHDIGSTDNLNPMIVNTSFSLGLNYGITNKLTFNFEPTFKYSLSPINNNSQFDYHPYYFSWFTGIRYSF